MYRAMVSRQYRRAWQSMNVHDSDTIIAMLALRFTVSFVGDTCLGGSRSTRAAMVAWFERFFRLFPDARFEMTAMAIDGPPWNTRVAGTFIIRATVADEPYENVFVQFLTLRWGKVTGYTIYEDSLRFAHACAAMAAAGIDEALAPPITDDPADVAVAA